MSRRSPGLVAINLEPSLEPLTSLTSKQTRTVTHEVPRSIRPPSSPKKRTGMVPDNFPSPQNSCK